MADSLGAFHTAVSTEINRGTQLDTYIVDATRRAARFLENNWNWSYMERYVTFTIDASAPQPRSVQIPTLLKKIEFLRINNSDGSFDYLYQVDPKNVTARLESKPSGYWLDGRDYLWLDNTPTVDYTAEMGYLQFTDWPTDTNEAPWLVVNGEGLLLAQTMIYLAQRAREPKYVQLYSPMRDLELQALQRADQDYRETNASDKMIYGAEVYD